MITCRELSDFLDDYLSGSLTVAQRRAFDEHLGVCPDCVNYLESYQASVALGKSVLRADDDVPAGVPEQLVEAILKARRAK